MVTKLVQQMGVGRLHILGGEEKKIEPDREENYSGRSSLIVDSEMQVSRVNELSMVLGFIMIKGVPSMHITWKFKFQKLFGLMI